MIVREQVEEWEEEHLSPLAAKSKYAKRLHNDEYDLLRTAYQRDRDRIIHSKAFRRLKHKTQVYIAPSDHYRTRMTHTLEVGQIGRTIARALRLNEDLVEAIAMGHDVGHTPFGHVGEYVLRQLVGHFNHNEQSLHIVDDLERDGQGLNLTDHVRDGILGHTGTHIPCTLEGQIIRTADRIAYLCHDFDDALRAKLLTVDQIPREVVLQLGDTPSKMITTMVMDMVKESDGQKEIRMSQDTTYVMNQFRNYMFKHVYLSPQLMVDRKKAAHVVEHLYLHYLENPNDLREDAAIRGIVTVTDIVDYVAGLTDQFAIEQFQKKFIPRMWHVDKDGSF